MSIRAASGCWHASTARQHSPSAQLLFVQTFTMDIIRAQQSRIAHSGCTHCCRQKRSEWRPPAKIVLMAAGLSPPSRLSSLQFAAEWTPCCHCKQKFLPGNIRQLGLLLQDETQFSYLCFGWAGRQEHASHVHANQGEPLQAVSLHFVLQSLPSCYPVLSEPACSTLTLSLVEQEEPGALATPPKTAAAGIYTFEDNQGGDCVLDVAPEPAKKSNKAVKAGKMSLEELQVRHFTLPKRPGMSFLPSMFLCWSLTNCGVVGCGVVQ